METINDRIRAIYEEEKKRRGKYTKTAFAENLGLAQPFVSDLLNKKNNPSDRTIRDICRIFNVNEEWLRHGTGEMYKEIAQDERIAKMIDEAMSDDDPFKKMFLSVCAGLNDEDWKSIKKIVGMFITESNKHKAPEEIDSDTMAFIQSHKAEYGEQPEIDEVIAALLAEAEAGDGIKDKSG